MRPLVHPSPEEMTVQGILHALSDPVRVRIFMQIMTAECAQSCSMLANAGTINLAKSTLSQHFTVLREAGLIRSERKGVELQNRPRWDDFEKRFGGMVTEILQAYGKELAPPKRARR